VTPEAVPAMTARVRYRRASIDDAEALSAFATRAFTDTYAQFNTPENMRAYLSDSYGEAHQRRELSDPAMTTVVAEDDQGIVGFAQVRKKETPACVTQPHAAEIYRFYVDRRAHGAGVAQRLMQETRQAARELGAHHLWLGVWERNPRAIAFYTKEGFTDIGTQTFKLGDDPQTDRVLITALTS
jgi:diamine N-acetyltransferase